MATPPKNEITQNKKAMDIVEPENIQIDLNFRCHYPILKLSHLIFEMIFLFFPQTLDKVKCDFTKDISGYQPSIINNLDSFVKKFTEKDINDIKNVKEFNFAFNHSFICRNNLSEKDLNEKYKNKVFTSTISESKGMEFEIVIIYNK